MSEVITTEDLDIIINNGINNDEELIEEKFIYTTDKDTEYASNIKVDVTLSNGGWNDCYIKIYRIADTRKPKNKLLRLCIIPGEEQVVVHKRNGAHGANPTTKSIKYITMEQAEYYNRLLYMVIDPSGKRIVDLIADEFKNSISTNNLSLIRERRKIIDDRLVYGDIDVTRAVGKPARGVK